MANFEIAYKRIEKYEGSYVYALDDNGGKTYAGLSRKVNPNWIGWKMIDVAKKKKDFLQV
jgi:lysozyme family protein